MITTLRKGGETEQKSDEWDGLTFRLKGYDPKVQGVLLSHLTDDESSAPRRDPEMGETIKEGDGLLPKGPRAGTPENPSLPAALSPSIQLPTPDLGPVDVPGLSGPDALGLNSPIGERLNMGGAAYFPTRSMGGATGLPTPPMSSPRGTPELEEGLEALNQLRQESPEAQNIPPVLMEESRASPPAPPGSEAAASSSDSFSAAPAPVSSPDNFMAAPAPAPAPASSSGAFTTAAASPEDPGTRFETPPTGTAPSLVGGTAEASQPDTTMASLAAPNYNMAGWEDASRYKGLRWPPLGRRLEQVLNYLREEDVDRGISFNSTLTQIALYLHWLWFQDADHQLRQDGVDPHIERMFWDAVWKCHVHVLWQMHYYKPRSSDAAVPPRPQLPVRSNRLVWMLPSGSEFPVGATPQPPRARDHLMPRPLLSRPTAPVNRMPLLRGDAAQQKRLRAILDKFASDQEEYWNWTPEDEIRGSSGAGQRNIAAIEDEAFRGFANSAHDSKGRLVRAPVVRRDPRSGGMVLPGGRVVDPDKPRDWACERAARRLGLQLTLRGLRRPGRAVILTGGPAQRLVLPEPAVARRQRLERVRGLQYRPAMLTPAQQRATNMRPPHEPIPYTVAFGKWFDRLRHARKGAVFAAMALERMGPLSAVEREKFGRQLLSAVGLEEMGLLPAGGKLGVAPALVKQFKSVGIGGSAFALADARPAVLERKKLLRECAVALDMLALAAARDRRPLVVRALELAREGLLRGDPASRLARKAELQGAEVEGMQADDWEAVPKGGASKTRQRAKLVELREVKWVKFLAGECRNGLNWPGVVQPKHPRHEFRLFQLFAARVRRLLDDRSPDALFGDRDRGVSVEELLAAITPSRSGAGGAADRIEFTPYDACKWLTRMNNGGFVRFRLDATCYGVVQRPSITLFPEHRVILPKDKDSPDSYRPEAALRVMSWANTAKVFPVVEKGDGVWNFFCGLAFRLGSTISDLKHTLSEDEKTLKQASTQRVKKEKARLFEQFLAWENELEPANADLVWTDLVCTVDATHDVNTELDEAGALRLLRDRIIDEASEPRAMLFPARVLEEEEWRAAPATGNKTGGEGTIVVRRWLVRDTDWSWASARARPHGCAPKQFFSLDQWPPGRGFLSSRAEAAVRGDAGLDTMAQMYDAADWDATEPEWRVEKLRPFADEPVVFRPGPVRYTAGDTKLQRMHIQHRITDAFHQSIGLERPGRSWASTVARLNPFAGPRPPSPRDEDRQGVAFLPRVRDCDVPPSLDTEEERQRREQAAEEQRGAGRQAERARREGEMGEGTRKTTRMR